MYQVKRNHFVAFMIGMMLILSGCAGDGNSRSAGNMIDDAAITTKVKSSLLADKDVSGTSIEVETFKGNVQLSGFVNDHHQVKKAEEIARKTQGVRSVTNDLIVKSSVKK